MPLVREVIPQRYLQSSYDLARAESVLDVGIKVLKMNNGSPCAGHAAIFEDWPGEELFVRQWFVLESGQALGINETPDGDWTFPVVDYEP